MWPLYPKASKCGTQLSGVDEDDEPFIIFLDINNLD